jgi:hypothetical protein
MKKVTSFENQRLRTIICPTYKSLVELSFVIGGTSFVPLFVRKFKV